MSRERLVQEHFSEISAEWPKSPEIILNEARQRVYERAATFWEGFNISLPGRDTTETFIGERGQYEILVSARHKNIGHPRYKDIEIPESLMPFIEGLIGSREEKGKDWGKERLMYEIDFLMLYGHWPISPEEDRFRYLEHEQEYSDWFYKTWREWFDTPPKLLGWDVQVSERYWPPLHFNFSFSPKGRLQSLCVYNPVPKTGTILDSRPYAATRASFKGDRLFSFFQSVPNGTFFPDPKGSKDSIWPHWVKGTEPDYDKTPDATEEDWENYLERVRNRERVISGRTGRYVYQTERQARENLERWRSYIYYKTSQAFYFRMSRKRPFGYRSELGYPLSGQLPGVMISTNPESKRSLGVNETVARLLAWDPAKIKNMVETDKELDASHKSLFPESDLVAFEINF